MNHLVPYRQLTLPELVAAVVRIRDGRVTRSQLKAVILQRIWWERFRYLVLLSVSIVAMLGAVIAAIEGWR